MPIRRHCLRTGAAALVAFVAFAASTATANAGVLTASGTSCADQPVAKTFLPWLDVADYTPLAGASFESGADGWTLSSGATVANGNEPYAVGGSDDSHSLALAAGASATSPAMCVGLDHPTMRFFAKRRSGGMLSLSTLRVDILVPLVTGDTIALPISLVGNGGSWQPTLPTLLVGNLLPLVPGDTTPVSFRFTAQGADWSVDDVYVDPYSRH